MRRFLATLVLICAGSVSAQPLYSKTTEYAALCVSYSALQAVLDKAHSLASSANGGAKPEREELTLGARELRINLPGNNLVSTPAKVPEQIDQLKYSFIGGASAPIVQVELDLAGYRRTLTVRGSSADQVDALFATISSDLLAMSHPIGGTSLQRLLGLPLLWTLGVMLILTGWSWYVTRARGYGAIAIATLAAFALTVALPLDQMLAGFFGVRGDSSALVRYGPEISFFGLLLAFVGIPAAVLPFWKRKQVDATSTGRAEQAPRAVAATSSEEPRDPVQ